ncbi:MAG: serine kinase [Rhodobacteraceae bacterium]|nr:serine kinase [Paracoccaceae bacterium]
MPSTRPSAAARAAAAAARAGRPLHATAVALGAGGLLILGPSGAGKSGLALALMAAGAELVADDGVIVTAAEGIILARAPGPTAGLIEARGLGLLRVGHRSVARITAIADLSRTETLRLPPSRTLTLLGRPLPLLHAVASPHFAAALIAYLRAGGRAV